MSGAYNFQVFGLRKLCFYLLLLGFYMCSLYLMKTYKKKTRSMNLGSDMECYGVEDLKT